MKRLFSLTAFILCVSVAFIFSCDDDESTPSMTLTLDGEEVRTKSITGILRLGAINNARGLRLVGEFDNKTYFIISIANQNFQNPPEVGIVEKSTLILVFAGNDGQGVAECQDELCDGAEIRYALKLHQGNYEEYISVFDESLTGFVEVTVSKGKKISGNFDIMLSNHSEGGSNIHATGTFKDVRYKVEHSKGWI